MKFREFEGKRGMAVTDGRRIVAVARYRNTGKLGRRWVLKAYWFSWASPVARTPNAFGISDPRYWVGLTKQDARSVLQELASA